MYTKKSFSVKLSGSIGGNIWWPRVKANKRFNITAKDDDTLRDVILHVTNDGDFEDCDILDGAIEVTLYKPNRCIVRWFDLSLPMFMSIQDCLSKNPEEYMSVGED